MGGIGVAIVVMLAKSSTYVSLLILFMPPGIYRQRYTLCGEYKYKWVRYVFGQFFFLSKLRMRRIAWFRVCLTARNGDKVNVCVYTDVMRMSLIILCDVSSWFFVVTEMLH